MTLSKNTSISKKI